MNITRTTLVALVALLLLAAPPSPTEAEICALDVAPAATLLLPWFEVDYGHFSTTTTLFSVTNTVAEAKLTRVTVWSDLGVPMLWFNLYLTGWDVETVNLRDVLAGHLPGGDGEGPHGDLSVAVEYPGCDVTLPYAPLPDVVVSELRAALTGEMGPLTGQCAGRAFGDDIARGYVTIDVVDRCSLTNPGPDYYGPDGELAFDNVLVGDFFVVDPSNDSAWGDELVRLEAEPESLGPGDRTFYQSWVGATGADAREPLPTVWSSRFLLGGGFDGGTDLIVWRDSGVAEASFDCPGEPSWFPLPMRHFVYFDEQENVVVDEGCVIGTCEPEPEGLYHFPAQANRVSVGSADLPVFFPFGWLVADLNPGDPGVYRQAWMGTVLTAEGRYAVGFDASPLDRSCAPSSFSFDPAATFAVSGP